MIKVLFMISFLGARDDITFAKNYSDNEIQLLVHAHHAEEIIRRGYWLRHSNGDNDLIPGNQIASIRVRVQK
jgi:hypothetical protein